MTKNKKSREQRLHVAPEFAANNLANALGGDKEEAAVPIPVSEATTEEWVVFGVDTVAQMAAENAARNAGQTLGAWLSDLIGQTAADKK